MFTPRSSGVLLHPTSFPSPYGIGDLGDEAFRFVDWLQRAGQRWWQILPLNPTWDDGSPYKSPSAFAGNPLLISPDRLVRDDILADSDLAAARSQFPPSGSRIDYHAARECKNAILRMAFDRMRSQPTHPISLMFKDYRGQPPEWMKAHAAFMAHRQFHPSRPWTEWNDASNGELADEILFQEFAQFLFDRQWQTLKSYAHQRGVRMIGDLPIYVAPESADVWANRGIFLLDSAGRPTEVAGVPPDYFSATGQLWNNPIYDWEALARDGFAWWIKRLSATLEQVDVARIDHFRGFEAYWAVPAGQETAIHGQWKPGPRDNFFQALTSKFSGGSESLPLIAEDLGTITAEVTSLRQRFGLPGMRVLHFEFMNPDDHALRVEGYPVDSVVYSGTHDNDTTRGWFESEIKPQQYRWDRLRQIIPARDETISWDLIELAWRSGGVLAVAPLQDILDLGTEARMNMPGTEAPAHPNWQWRYAPEALTEELADRLRQLTVDQGRG